MPELREVFFSPLLHWETEDEIEKSIKVTWQKNLDLCTQLRLASAIASLGFWLFSLHRLGSY